MRHNYILSGNKFRIRPINNDDAQFCIDLRTNQQLNQYLNPTSSILQDQINWLENYYNKNDDYYFVVENIKNNKKEGLIALYDIDKDTNSAEWGRWILRVGSLGAVESALLIYKFAFDYLDLDKVYCRTVENNQKVVSFHDSCGITDKKTLINYFHFKEQNLNSIQHTIDKDTAKKIINYLQNISDRFSKNDRSSTM